jgi:hypothetical protein
MNNDTKLLRYVPELSNRLDLGLWEDSLIRLSNNHDMTLYSEIIGDIQNVINGSGMVLARKNSH